jgi:hypothetical protein
MLAVGALVRCTDGSWMTRPPQSCRHGHPLRPGAMLVGLQPCSTCRGEHREDVWTGAARPHESPASQNAADPITAKTAELVFC